jgi:hypothetical protein
LVRDVIIVGVVVIFIVSTIGIRVASRQIIVVASSERIVIGWVVWIYGISKVRRGWIDVGFFRVIIIGLKSLLIIIRCSA